MLSAAEGSLWLYINMYCSYSTPPRLYKLTRWLWDIAAFWPFTCICLKVGGGLCCLYAHGLLLSLLWIPCFVLSVLQDKWRWDQRHQKGISTQSYSHQTPERHVAWWLWGWVEMHVHLWWGWSGRIEAVHWCGTLFLPHALPFSRLLACMLSKCVSSLLSQSFRVKSEPWQEMNSGCWSYWICHSTITCGSNDLCLWISFGGTLASNDPDLSSLWMFHFKSVYMYWPC